MKKVCKILLLLILLMPIMVKADMSAPNTIDFTAVVVKEGGADYYDTSIYESVTKIGHLEKGERLVIDFEMEQDGIVYAYAKRENDDKERFCVDVKDIMPDGGPITPDNPQVEKLNKPAEYEVIVDEVEVKEGPSMAYKKVGTLKKGHTGQYNYKYEAYMYIEEGDLKGWVEMIDRKVLTKSDRDLIVYKDVETKCGVIPANTILTDVWDTVIWNMSSRIRYNGCEDFVTTFRSHYIYYITNTPNNFQTKEPGKIYESSKFDKEIATIPTGVTLTIYARNGEIEPDDYYPFYTEYNGTKGWYARDEYVENLNNYETENPTTEPVENPNGSEQDPIVEPPIEDVAPKEETKDEKPSGGSKGLDSMTIVIMCCIGAISAALGSIITIVLVNKKKKKQEQVSTAEVPTEEPKQETIAVEPVEQPPVEPVEQITITPVEPENNQSSDNNSNQ